MCNEFEEVCKNNLQTLNLYFSFSLFFKFFFPSIFPKAKHRVWKLRNTAKHAVLKSVHPKQNEEQHTISSSKKKRRTPHKDFLT